MVICDFEESHYCDSINGYNDNLSIDTRMSNSYMLNNWTQVAETTLPLKESKLATVNRADFQTSVELRSRQISTKIIVVNLISLLINLLLAIAAFYFAFANNSASTTAFAADCVLDFISSAIVLWRYQGDLNSVYMHAREQIACIYLGALFLISSLGIIIKASTDIVSGTDFIEADVEASYELVYLAIVASIACSVLVVFKCALYKTLRDNSILLDVINTLISTVFAMSIVMSQALININPSFWYLDPILSIVLAMFMFGFGIKVIHQNFHILKPIYYNQPGNFNDRSYGNHDQVAALIPLHNNNGSNRIGNQAARSMYNRNLTIDKKNLGDWRKTDYSTIAFS